MEEVNELDELQEQVKELEERVYKLEKHEAARKVKSGIKLLISLLMIGAVVFGIFYAYNYITNELPKMIENEVKEKGNDAINSIKDTTSNTIDKIKDTIKGN